MVQSRHAGVDHRGRTIGTVSADGPLRVTYEVARRGRGG
jgi:hypothetical protein